MEFIFYIKILNKIEKLPKKYKINLKQKIIQIYEKYDDLSYNYQKCKKLSNIPLN